MQTNPYIRINDLTANGGGFIRGKRIGRTFSGEIYTGTVYYDNGRNADVIALIYPYGNGRILAQARETKECTEDYRNLVDYLNRLEANNNYKKHLTVRAIINFVTGTSLLLIIGKYIIDMVDINPTTSIWNAAYLLMETAAILLVRKIRTLAKEI